MVVSQSDDASEDLRVGAAAGARVLVTGPTGLPAARNTGLAATCSPIVVFLDDDVRLGAGAIEALVAPFAAPDVGATVARIVEDLPRNAPPGTNGVGADGRVRVNLLADHDAFVHSVKGAAFAARRAAIAQVGTFDARIAGTFFLEETDLSERLRRAGWRIRLCADAHVRHLLAPAGGCRSDRISGDVSRFFATGRFVRSHRSRRTVPPVFGAFAAIAALRGATHRDPRVTVTLVAALLRGLGNG